MDFAQMLEGLLALLEALGPLMGGEGGGGAAQDRWAACSAAPDLSTMSPSGCPAGFVVPDPRTRRP